MTCHETRMWLAAARRERAEGEIRVSWLTAAYNAKTKSRPGLQPLQRELDRLKPPDKLIAEKMSPEHQAGLAETLKMHLAAHNEAEAKPNGAGHGDP